MEIQKERLADCSDSGVDPYTDRAVPDVDIVWEVDDNKLMRRGRETECQRGSRTREDREGRGQLGRKNGVGDREEGDVSVDKPGLGTKPETGRPEAEIFLP